MNIIHVPMFGITVSETTARKTVITFMNELITRNPVICERIYSYMAQEYLPDRPQASTHMLAKRRTSWENNGFYKTTDALGELNNGWFLYTNLNPSNYASRLLARIEEAINPLNGSFKIYCYLATPQHPEQAGIRHYTPQDVELLTK